MDTIQFVQDIKNTTREFTDDLGFKRWTVAKPEGITLWWRIRAALAVLQGKACAVHWQ